MINIHKYIYHLYSIDINNSRYMYINGFLYTTYFLYIFYNLHILYILYIDLHQLPSKPIRGSWLLLALQTFAVILATGGEPKVPQLKDATKAMSLEVTFQKDSRHIGGMGEGKHPGCFFLGKKTWVWKKWKFIGCWNCRMGWFFGLIGLIGVCLFLLKWDSCSLWLWRKYKILGVLIEWWVRKATDEVFIAELPCLKLTVGISLNYGPTKMDDSKTMNFINENFAVVFVPCFQSAARCHI